MNAQHLATITTELGIAPLQIEAVAGLLADGATIPFIARYRKEVTGSLDEVQIQAIRDRIGQLAELDSRREAILASLEKHGHLTDELKQKVQAAETMAVLEDIYLPFRPKRRTKATIAREKGLEPLALLILEQQGSDPEQAALPFVDAEKGVASTEEALEGARPMKPRPSASFAANLRELLLAPPLGQKNVLAIDPGFRTGCKVVCLDRQGKLLHHDVIYPTPAKSFAVRTRPGRVALCEQFRDRGHRHRQRHGRPRDRGLRPRPRAGPRFPSSWSTKAARRSIRPRGGPRRVPRPGPDRARRGLHRAAADGPAGRTGQDRPQIHRRRPVPARCGPDALKRGLDDVVISCVNRVGVEVNTASKQLLSYVSGLARAGPEHRRLPQRKRPVQSRKELLKVPRLGPRPSSRPRASCASATGPTRSTPARCTRKATPSWKMAADLGCTVRT
jgi:hypothetical protein